MTSAPPDLRLAPHRELRGPGTAEAVWAAHPRLAGLPRADVRGVAARRVVLVAPHPDDEILGAGGSAALLARAGLPVVLVAVTDGERSRPGRVRALRRVRPAESDRAAQVLGLRYEATHRLRHPDGDVNSDLLVAALLQLLRPDDLVLAPWPGDGHPDHDRTGAASQHAAGLAGSDLWAYFVWAWQWSAPDADALPWDQMARVELGTSLQEAKARAVACFASQLCGREPILPDHVLDRLLRPFEVVAPL